MAEDVCSVAGSERRRGCTHRGIHLCEMHRARLRRRGTTSLPPPARPPARKKRPEPITLKPRQSPPAPASEADRRRAEFRRRLEVRQEAERLAAALADW